MLYADKCSNMSKYGKSSTYNRTGVWNEIGRVWNEIGRDWE